MKIVLHGAAKEVGRSCIEIKTNGEKYILDAGVKFTEGGVQYPEAILNYPAIDALFISHAHLDHTGALPVFEHNKILCPIYCTKLTYELTKVLLKDSYKIARISHLDPAYERTDLKKISKSIRMIKYNTEYKHKDLKFTYRNAGHIPGSASIEIQAEGKKILYSGDIKLSGTEVMEGAHTDYKNVDVLISEATNAARVIPNKEETKKKFLQRIDEITRNGGSVLLPAFSIGRSQDLFVMLSEKKFKVPIYYEGLMGKATRKMVDSSQEVAMKNKKILQHMLDKGAKHIKGEKQRQKAMAKPGIFLATSGMIQGGPVLSYIKEMWHDEKSAIFLSGFQCKRTNGRHLLEDGYVYIDGWRTYVKCKVEKFDFTGHASLEELKQYITKVNPKILIFNHADIEATTILKEWAKKNTKCKVYATELGEEINVD